MLAKRDIELKLAEYRTRYSGKDPFGPWSDLDRFYSSLSENEKLIMDSVLQERMADPFWKSFIALFYEGR